MAYFYLIAAVVVCYLLGSVNFAVILSWAYMKKDVRTLGSGNAGMTNMLRSVGVVPGILTFVGDVLKGVAAALIGKYLLFGGLFDVSSVAWANPVYMSYICASVCQLGHIFPIFYGFRGGKSVATGIGGLAICDWRSAIVALAVFLVVLLITGVISAGSILGTATVPFSTFFINRRIDYDPNTLFLRVVLATVVAALIIMAHIPNIIRLFKGEEKRLRIKGSRGADKPPESKENQ